MPEVQVPSLAERFAPRQTALVVIDVQNDFCDPVDFPAARPMLPRLERLLTVARAVGVKVIYTQVILDERTSTPVWLSRYAGRPNRHFYCAEGTPGADFYPQTAPQPGDLVVVKHRYSAFLGTDFELVLRAHGITALVFTGISTNGCVESSVRDAHQRDYWVVTVSDCCAAATSELHEGALRGIAWNFGTVATADELTRLWEAHGAPALTAAPAAGARAGA
jgi:ureidoacrylate peracid hydrolase